MEPDNTDRQSAPLPHFDVLRQEMEEDQARVKEFMKGSFTYKVTEKQPTTKVLFLLYIQTSLNDTSLLQPPL